MKEEILDADLVEVVKIVESRVFIDLLIRFF